MESASGTQYIPRTSQEHFRHPGSIQSLPFSRETPPCQQVRGGEGEGAEVPGGGGGTTSSCCNDGSIELTSTEGLDVLSGKGVPREELGEGTAEAGEAAGGSIERVERSGEGD